MSRSTSANIKSKDGDQLAVQQHESDSPLIPVGQMEQLHNFRPDLVDWIVQQTQAEAEFRRKETSRVNNFIFFNKTLGQVGAALMGLSGICGGAYVAIVKSPWAGAEIATAAIAVLAVVFLTGKNPKND